MSSIVGIVLGFGLSVGSILTYVPQLYKIIKNKSVQGISEPSLVLMNIGMMCLNMNLVIRSWNYFFCQSFQFFSNLLPLINVTISWLMTFIYYIIFITCEQSLCATILKYEAIICSPFLIGAIDKLE